MLALATSPVRRLLKANRQPGDFQRSLLTGRAREYPCRARCLWQAPTSVSSGKGRQGLEDIWEDGQ